MFAPRIGAGAARDLFNFVTVDGGRGVEFAAPSAATAAVINAQQMTSNVEFLDGIVPWRPPVLSCKTSRPVGRAGRSQLIMVEPFIAIVDRLPVSYITNGAGGAAIWRAPLGTAAACHSISHGTSPH